MQDVCEKCMSETVRVPAKVAVSGLTGAAVGSVLPIIGTGFGALLGGVGGAVASAISDNNKYVQFCPKCKHIEYE